MCELARTRAIGKAKGSKPCATPRPQRMIESVIQSLDEGRFVIFEHNGPDGQVYRGGVILAVDADNLEVHVHALE